VGEGECKNRNYNLLRGIEGDICGGTTASF